MAWMPGVDISRVATDGNSKLTCSPNIVCIHTIAGYAPASAAHFSTNANGKIWQHRDSVKRSAANGNGNSHIIAIENEDHGSSFGSWSGTNVPGFTSAQIEANAQICAWAYKTHRIPLVLCPNSKPGSRGIAYHRQGIDGNFDTFAYPGRVPGGELWSTSFGKVCPGDRRISQIPQIIARARQIVGLEGGGDLQVKNLILGKAPDGKIYVGDGLTRRYVVDTAELEGLQYWIKSKGGDSVVHDFADLRVLGVDVNVALGELAAGDGKILSAVQQPVPVQIDYERFVADVVDRLATKLSTLRFDVN